MKVIIKNLPLSIQKQLPMSIRTYKTEYDLDELPPKEKELIRQYIESIKSIFYSSVYDISPNISKFADFETIPTIKELVLEYLKNYLYTLPGEYPFDPSFGCELKRHLQTKDTELRKTLVHNEIMNIVNILSADLGVAITVNGISISPTDNSSNVEYNCSISLTIESESAITIGVTGFQ